MVPPGGYGTANAGLLRARARADGRFRGIAVIDWATPDPLLRERPRRGVVGVRLNLPRAGAALLSRPGAREFLHRMTGLGWLVEV